MPGRAEHARSRLRRQKLVLDDGCSTACLPSTTRTASLPASTHACGLPALLLPPATHTPSPHAHKPTPAPSTSSPAPPPAEGRLHPITGNLQCSYHGWQFSGSGACTDIPQAPDAKAHNVARASKRSCARAFPTTSRHGLLWVWLESGPQAEQESEQAPVLAVPEMEGEGGIYYPFAKW